MDPLFDTELFEEIEDEDVDDQGELTEVMYELIDDITLGLCFEVHRQSKIGTLFLDDTDPESPKQYREWFNAKFDLKIIDERGMDVFGQVPMKKQYECLCPNCQRNLAASRFAPHLEKCMGMGRNSSRIASRRIQANTGRGKDSDESDGDNDNDWSYANDRKTKKLRKDKNAVANSPRRGKPGRLKNVDSSSSLAGDANQPPPYESMSLEERKSILLHSCGVISEHTKKMCTRSVRCPQHTDEQRKAVRRFLLVQQTLSAGGAEDLHVDIDTYDEPDGGSSSLREALQWSDMNPSPADSNSTNNSTGSRKRKHSKVKKPGKVRVDQIVLQ